MRVTPADPDRGTGVELGAQAGQPGPYLAALGHLYPLRSERRQVLVVNLDVVALSGQALTIEQLGDTA